MTAILAAKAARRRGILFIVLLVVTVLMMAFSSNPTVREFQNAIGFAFRPIQGALDSAAGSVASVATIYFIIIVSYSVVSASTYEAWRATDGAKSSA